MPSATLVVPGAATPGGSKKAFVVPASGPVTLKLKPSKVYVIARDKTLREGRTNIVDANEERLRPWQEVVRLFANKVVRSADPLTGSLAIMVRFERRRPKSHYRTGRSTAHLLTSSAPARPTMAPDTTKLLRGFEDALTALLWADDAQVVWQLAEKVYADEDRVTLTVWELGLP